MQHYRTLSNMGLHGGMVELDKDQARRRKTHLKVIKEPKDKDNKPYVNGVYQIMDYVFFKKGEVFGYTGEFTKVQLATVAEKIASKEIKEEKDKEKKAKEVEKSNAEAKEAEELAKLQKEIDDLDALDDPIPVLKPN